MATLGTWTAATRRHLMSGRAEQRNTLSAPYTPGSGSLALTFASDGIVPGTRLTVGLNIFYVVVVPAGSLTITVIAAQEGSADVAAPAGDLVRVNPRFTDFEIVEALASDLADLSAPDNGLFQIRTVDLVAANGTLGYDLAGVADLIEIYDVRARQAGAGKDYSLLAKVDYRLDRSADVAVFASGLSLQLMDMPVPVGQGIRVLYRSGFTAPPTLATDLSTTGLPATAWDIPPIGAAMRLVIPREVKRNFTEAATDTRRASEVPPGAVSNSARSLAAWRLQRIQAEAARLSATWPDRRF